MGTHSIRIAIHHRYPILQECLSLELSRRFNADVLGLPCKPEATQPMLKWVQEAQPDVLILDLDALRQGQPVAASTAVDLLTAIRAAYFGIKIITLSECHSFSFINAVLCAWSNAHLIATYLTIKELIAGCEAVQSGALFLCAQSKHILSAAHSRSATLTTREVEIVRLLAAHPNDQYQHLAGLLHVTSGTMRTHLANLRLKLGVQSNHEMIDAVRTLGFIE